MSTNFEAVEYQASYSTAALVSDGTPAIAYSGNPWFATANSATVSYPSGFPWEASPPPPPANLRKPLYLDANGKRVEMAATDSIQLGGITLTGALEMGSSKVTGVAQATASGDLLSWGRNASIGDLTVTGALGGNLDAGAYRITNLADPTSAQEAATKAYADAFKDSLDFKDAVRVIATSGITLSGLQTIDGVSVQAGDRVLVSGNGAASGIYVAASGAWSRATDADATAKLGPSSFCFVLEGTSHADTGWVMSADDVFNLGSTSQTWVQFSGKGITLAGVALSKTGNTVDVLYGDGLAVDGSNRLAVSLADDPGLRFASGKLDLDLASADRLSKGASGLDVVGLPSSFKLDGGAVSANVTAANLTTLTAGIESDGTPLHVHSRVETERTRSETLAALDPVYVTGVDTVGKADAGDDAKRYVVGIVRSVSGMSVRIVSKGIVPGVLTGATAGDRYYLQDGGGLGMTKPGAGKSLVMVGVAVNATDFLVGIRDQGKFAL